MSRKKVKRVTVPVTKPAKEPVIKTTVNTIMECMDHAEDIGVRAGLEVGVEAGIAHGMKLPRNAGEQRAQDQGEFVARILREVFLETKNALRKHGPMHSGYEGYAVLKEEVDELWAEIKADRGQQKSARTEAIQIAAMAVRYALDIDPR